VLVAGWERRPGAAFNRVESLAYCPSRKSV
jgi:hypothetical protein